MTGIAVLALCILCYTFKSFLNKLFAQSYPGEKKWATPTFSIISGMGCAVFTWVFNGFSFAPDSFTIVMGLINGVVLFLYNLATINASLSGPYSFQSLMSTSGNIILPLLFTSLWCHESLSVAALIGIAVMLLSFVLFNAKSLTLSGAKKGYFFWVTLLCTTNGVYGIMMDAQQRGTANALRNEMIMVTFVTCTLISLVYLAIVNRGKLAQPFKMGRTPWLQVIGISVFYAIATNLMMVALGLIQAAVMYTAINGGVLVLSVLLGTVFFKEKFDVFKAVGLATAVIALILLGM